MSRKSLQKLENRLQETTEPAGLWRRLELSLPEEGEAGGLWPRLEERLELARTPPRLRQGLVLKPIQPGNVPAFLLSDPLEKRYFRLGQREVDLLSLLNGEREPSDLAQAYQEEFGPITVEVVQCFVQELRGAGLLEQGMGLWGYLGLARRRGPLVLWALPQAEEKLLTLYRRLRFLFHPLAWVLAAGLLLGSIVPPILQGEALWLDIEALFSSWRWLLLLLGAFYPAMALIALTHEVAHALTCTHFGGGVSRLGLMVQHLLPAAFADVSDIWSMSRGARIAVFLSGPASTAAWAALATALWTWTQPGSFPHLLGAAVMLACFFSLFVSLNPLAGYDGSEVLAEWLGVPGLHRRALSYCWARLRGRPHPRIPPWPSGLFWGYGLAVFLYNLAIVVLLSILLLHWLLP